MTLLGGKLAAGVIVPGGDGVTPLGAKLAAGRRGELVELPNLGAAWVEIMGALDFEEVEADMFRIQRNRGLELDMLTSQSYELVKARLTLARVVRHPRNHVDRFGTVEEWERVDTDTLIAAWQIYGDVRERLDPMAEGLSAERAQQIAAAVKKKDPALLRSFGVRNLSVWLATTDVQVASSQPPSSENSGSSSA